MGDTPSTESKARRRWITLGETLALAALVISALGLWNSWRSDEGTRPTPSEAKAAIPIAFRGKVEANGKALTISPIESGHSLESLTLTAGSKPAIIIGSDGRLDASQVQQLVGDPAKDKASSLVVRIEARYIEAGALKRGGGHYRISFRWDDGGLFGGDRLRLTGLGVA